MLEKADFQLLDIVVNVISLEKAELSSIYFLKCKMQCLLKQLIKRQDSFPTSIRWICF